MGKYEPPDVYKRQDMDGLEDYMKEYETQLNDEYAPIESGITLSVEEVTLSLIHISIRNWKTTSLRTTSSK